MTAIKTKKSVLANTATIDRLSIFTFLWAAQAIVHQEFFRSWVTWYPVLGWSLTILAWATLLWPSSLLLFTAMLINSVVFNIVKLPYVSNHNFLETVINITILLAIGWTWISLRRKNELIDVRARNEIFDRFAPVVGVMLIVVYYFAFIAKLNTDFLDPAVSCAVVLYGDLVRAFPFLPDASWTHLPVIWGTILIEGAIPVLLTFKRTRYLAILIGLPFHFMLGLIGHRTFAALAYALYSLYCIVPVMNLINNVFQLVRTRYGSDTISRYLRIARMIGFVVGVLFFVDLAFQYRPEGLLSILRIDWAYWLFGSMTVALVYSSGIMLGWMGKISLSRLERAARPGLLWLMVLLVLLTGLSQYIGLRTETSVTMYSNLRTEGERNNHLFMPSLRITPYQDDLVEVIETDKQELWPYIQQDHYITYFELRRMVSRAKEDNFYVSYRRGETLYEFETGNIENTDPELSQEYPVWLAKLFYFRPVSMGETQGCFH